MVDTLVSLTTAFILGGVIGLERQYRQRRAGLRTNVLVAVGAAMFVDIANRLHGAEGAVRVITYVESGVGFLGAGVIMREGGNVYGLDTAATIWGAAAIGASAGADLVLEAIFGTIFILAANILLRPIAYVMNQKSIQDSFSELTYALRVTTDYENQQAVLEELNAVLEKNNFSIHNFYIRAHGKESVEIEIIFEPLTIQKNQLNQIVQMLNAGLIKHKKIHWEQISFIK